MASNAPRLGLLELFGKFLVFGLRAWGGPVAQIAMLKEQLVIKEKWISIKKFNRVYAVYQVLPGPEAAELCCYFGMLSRGRLGALIAGLGFILPGFFLMLLLSYIYYLIGFSNVYVNASFRALQPVVAAFVLRAVHKIAEHAFHSHRTKKFSNVLFWLALASFLQSALRINFFITLGVFALLWFLWDRGNGMWAAGNKKHAYYWYAAAGVIIAADIAGYVAYVATRGFPGRNSLAIGIAPNPPDLGHLFALGLVAGVLSFGGAYTAIPFVQQEAVVLGKWLSNQVFLDGIAIGNVIPAPLVIFVTFVGFQGGLAGYNGNLGYAFAGAILMTLGMFIPCFSFTIIGHDFWEWLVMLDPIQSALEGVTASVTGLIAVVAMELLRYSVTVQLSDPRLPTAEDKLGAVNSNGVSAVLYVLTLISLYFFKAAGGKVSIILVVAAAIAGQFLYLPADA
ncbi:chromate transporter [Hyaloraphidium curvatum]|nr:chromate transporter [Hyaloraphidium curvatum]